MIPLLHLKDKRKGLQFFITMARPKIILNPQPYLTLSYCAWKLLMVIRIHNEMSHRNVTATIDHAYGSFPAKMGHTADLNSVNMN